MYEQNELEALTTLEFPLPGDLQRYDYFLSQYIHSLIKAGTSAGDGNHWFGRIIGYSSDAQKYVFRMNGVDYSMEHISNLIKNRDLAFEFISVDPITEANYVMVANGIRATVRATFTITDYRIPATSRIQFTKTFEHIIKPTFQAFNTNIYGKDEISGEVSIERTFLNPPIFPDPNDNSAYDVILSQYIASLHNDGNGIKSQWFGRAIGWSPGNSPQPYYFKLGSEEIPMDDLVNYVNSGLITFEFSNVTAINYGTDSTEGYQYGDITLDYIIMDNRPFIPIEHKKANVTIRHRIKPTYQIYHSEFII